MGKFVNYSWRLLATGFCFAFFSAGGFLMAVVLFPLVSLWPGSTEQKNRRIQKLVHHSFRMFVTIIEVLGIGRIKVEGKEWLKAAPGRLLLASHPTLLDVVVLISLLPLTDCIVKQALWHNFFLYPVVKGAGYINNSQSPAELLTLCDTRLGSGRPLLLFPEGTRSISGKPLHFQRGAAQIALRSSRDILPIIIQCNPPTLQKHQKWYQIPPQPWCITVRVLPLKPLQTFNIRQDSPLPVQVRHLTQGLQHFFQEEINRYEHAGY
ncbi:MAG TPA: lysophospholipid acyltransferase family protein [Gammaproteobacteria bacterium]|nr:lysophospholipid acyltransferase family protein [Gammaproteobacteria bacterium]